jgi:DNA polymerase-3 subunit gamma/tau
LTGLFADVARQEGAAVEPAAMSLIARAADGSARDGLSLLDQAISQASTGAAANVTEAAVRDMLGLADRARVFDLFDSVMRGDVKASLTLLGDQYASGASPIIVMQDLLELVHWLTKVKVAPDAANDPGLAETERTRGAGMAKQLGVPALTRAWNILLKGLGEARSAPIPLQAVEMVLIRLAYAADLPTPSDALKQLDGAMASARASAPLSAPTPPSSPRASLSAVSGSAAPAAEAQLARTQPVAVGSPAVMTAPQSFVGVVELFEERRQLTIAAHMRRGVRLVRFIGLEKGAPVDLPGQIGKLLTEWTGRRWMVSIANAAGDKTLHEQSLDRAKSDPLVKTILDTFPDAVIQNIRRAEES